MEGAPGAWRIQLNTFGFSVSNITFAPLAITGFVLLSSISPLYQDSRELGSPFCAFTFTVVYAGGIGSQGVPVVNPALGESSHCIGVRSPSRPFSFGQPVRPTGSFTSSTRVGGVVLMPISSP